MSSFYPTLKDEQILLLNVIVQSLKKDPNYLNAPECPYSETIKSFFRNQQGPVEVIDLFDGEDQILILDKQIEKLLNDLEAFAGTLMDADHSEKLQYFKTKTVLIERLIAMKERIVNLKELNDFRGAVIQLLDEVCTKDQITQFMKGLDK